MPEESDPRQLALARRLLRLEAYLVPAGVGLLVGMALAGAGSSPIEDWTLSGGALLLWLLLVGAAVAFWVAVSIKLGQRVWAYWVAVALQVGVILEVVLPFLPLFLVPCAALILLLHPVSRAAALPLSGQPAGVSR